ncbi:hypothetical protein K440DRAFT_623281 [Wilcoxina mikolae CBS 423.85]|nr:hypothetical protein K440DRAFT_623281 [Wilcoxina mikolae CBS 423.85]
MAEVKLHHLSAQSDNNEAEGQPILPDLSLRNELPQELPPSSASPEEAREFVLHVLCSDAHGLLETHREGIIQVYGAWDRSGEFLRNVSLRELRREFEPIDSMLGYALYVEVSRLQAIEAERARQVKPSQFWGMSPHGLWLLRDSWDRICAPLISSATTTTSPTTVSHP